MHFACVMAVGRLLRGRGRFSSECSAASRVVQERLFKFRRGRGGIGMTRRSVTVVVIMTSVAGARGGTVAASVVAATVVMMFGGVRPVVG